MVVSFVSVVSIVCKSAVNQRCCGCFPTTNMDSDFSTSVNCLNVNTLMEIGFVNVIIFRLISVIFRFSLKLVA